MKKVAVWVFFYGSYINRSVLKEVGVEPDHWEIARLSGYDIRIKPRANLVRAEPGMVYGILATATHVELEKLYSHALEVLGEVYKPEAIMAETTEGHWRPALCYISHTMQERTTDPEYLARILKPAKAYGFPAWYQRRLASFAT